MKHSRCKLCGAEAAVRYRLPDTAIHACPRCDLHFIDYLDNLSPDTDAPPLPSLSQQGRRYIEERIAAGEAVLPLRLALLQRYLPLAGARCLDVGAGTGQFVHRLTQAGVEAYGIEPSGLRRRFAAERFALRLQPEPVDSRHWQERFGTYFDALTLWEVIEHVNDPVATLRGAWSLLKAGGLLFIETPSRTVPPYRLSEWCYKLSRGRVPLFLGNFFAPITFGHKQIFTPAQLAAAVAGNGFDVLLRTAAYPDDPVRPLLKNNATIILVARKRAR